MNPVEIIITTILTTAFFATLSALVEKLTGTYVWPYFCIINIIVMCFIAMYDCHETKSVDLPEETPQVGDVLKVESNKDGVLSLGYYRAAKELKNK